MKVGRFPAWVRIVQFLLVLIVVFVVAWLAGHAVSIDEPTPQHPGTEHGHTD
ncbi:hypothetical protein [Nocardia brasiliensis]|uniref:hypothetical protein n=1 Tax=Nocardia brasiliensis TaxID=37326 RepID=UPI00031F7706|nr:hypothetical protein [Nocardia brasiliensis]